MGLMERRRGFTLIELLVVIVIIALLLALILPAVQQARETARRLTCAAQLKNIGLAIHQHHETRNAFPAGVAQGELRPFGGSYLIQVLPYLEQAALYNSINMAINTDANANLTVSQLPLRQFLCPSDASRDRYLTANCINYAGNAGHDPHRGEGVFIGRPLTASQITDGLSQTVGVAEWIVGPGTRERRSRLGSTYRLTRIFSDSPSDHDAFARACEALDSASIPDHHWFNGQFWLEGLLNYTLYNHVLPPNRPSCRADQDMSAISAGSLHPGGAHVLTMDGGVHFMRDSIDSRTWTAIGTRAGGEAVGDSSF